MMARIDLDLAAAVGALIANVIPTLLVAVCGVLEARDLWRVRRDGRVVRGVARADRCAAVAITVVEVPVLVGAYLTRDMPSFRLPNTLITLILASIMACAARLLRARAAAALGSAYRIGAIEVASDQRLVVDGPYRHVRHPLYAGLILVAAAFGLLIATGTTWLSTVAIVLVPIAGFPWLIRDEEQALLHSQLGERYRLYMRKIRYRLLPGIW